MKTAYCQMDYMESDKYMIKTCGVVANDSHKKQCIFMRQVVVYAYKYAQGYSNVYIADKLNVNKSSITRDLDAILMKESEFFALLHPYMEYVESNLMNREFLLKHTADQIKKYKIWLILAKQALEVYHLKLNLESVEDVTQLSDVINEEEKKSLRSFKMNVRQLNEA